MPRRVILATNEIYHIYNRSIAKELIFKSLKDLKRALEVFEFYRFHQEIRFSKFKELPKETKENYLLDLEKKKPIVEIYAFALMPNHFHFLLKQTQEKGIVQFISNFQNSFAKYFNLKNDRNGALFQNAFKGVYIEKDEQFKHVSRYIHLNPVTSYIIEFKDLSLYPWTSFRNYVSSGGSEVVNTDFILKMFSKKNSYIKFVADQVDYQRDLAKIRDLILE